jgi:crotonobetainyl-CoA:carnitine CoA-transferase CaiB-like acyl-CoA transferase
MIRHHGALKRRLKDMSKPFAGVRVVEVAAWTFVPVAGAMLADMGAEVIKVEPPSGDPQRALLNMLNVEGGGPNPFVEIPNRGKRSVTLDLRTQAGHAALMRLAAAADVFLTSYLPELRAKLRIDVDDLRAVNPKIIYARGSGWGSAGPMRNTGGYDLASAWATSGLADRLEREKDGPAPMPAAFFDLQGGNTIAGAIGAALFRRERTAEPSVIDVSLMNVGMWAMSPDIVSAPYVDTPRIQARTEPGNPITNWYCTADRRWIYLVLLQADRFWGELCQVMGRPDLVDDPRFANAAVRFQNRRACVAELDAIFGARTLEQWQKRFEGFSGVWAPALKFRELHDHPQVEANGYLPRITGHDGSEFRLVSAAMHFDEEPTAPAGPAPELGQDTETVLLDAGFEWEEIEKLREQGGLG